MTKPVNMMNALSARQMVPMVDAPRRFTGAQVIPFCEHLVTVMNKMLPAKFTLTKDGDSALTIRVEINRPALTGTPDVSD
jgi:hypothetical protein